VLTILIAGYILLVGTIFGLIHGKASFLFWGFSHFLDYVLQTGAYFILAMFMGVLLRKSALAVLAFMVIFFLAGILLEGMIEDLAQFSPMNAFNALVPNPYLSGMPGANQLSNITNSFEMGVGLRYLLVLFYMLFFVWLSNLVMKKRDL
jgi:flagellar biosynthesis protein FlhB